MTNDLESLYDKYADYVRRLHDDLARTGQSVSPDDGLELLCYEDFCRAWRRWGKTEGLQDTWRREFDLGYDRAALELSARLDAALFGKNPAVSGPTACEAA